MTTSVEENHRLERRDRQVLGLEDCTAMDVAPLEETRSSRDADGFEHHVAGIDPRQPAAVEISAMGVKVPARIAGGR